MAGRRPSKVPTVSRVTVSSVDDPIASRELSKLADAVNELQSLGGGEAFEVDLAVGVNAITHGLGRVPRAVHVTPTVANAAFAWAYRRDPLHDAKQILIEVIGAAQPRALVEVR